MQWSAFFRDMPKQLRGSLPMELADFQWLGGHGQAKAWYGNKLIHYEVWVRGRLHVVEVGLHFETDDLTNARLLAAFRARARQVKRALGDGARIEEWDRGWARVWEPISLETLDEELRERVSARLSAYMRALEPIVREELPSDVAWKLPQARRAAATTSSRTSR